MNEINEVTVSDFKTLRRVARVSRRVYIIIITSRSDGTEVVRSEVKKARFIKALPKNGPSPYEGRFDGTDLNLTLRSN
jgi:hypothetical protein